MNKGSNYILWAIGVVLLLNLTGTSLAVSPPERINFQGVLRDASGAPVADGTYSMIARFFGNGAGACDCGEANGSPGCTDAVCEAEVCAIDSFCCTSQWDLICAAEAEQFASCQACMADEEVLRDSHAGLLGVAVTGGLFNVALGNGSVSDGSGAGFYGSLGAVFRDFDVVYVEIEVNGEVLSPRIRVEASAYTQNALQLEGKRAAEFLDTSAAAQTKTGDLEVQGNVTVGDVTFSDGSVLKSARPDPPCFDFANRFADCGNGTVTDTLTGLILLKDANCFGLTNFVNANGFAASLADGLCGLTDASSPGDWRLMTKEEWEGLLKPSCPTFPKLPNTPGTGCYSAGPQWAVGVELTNYWSSATYGPNPVLAWNGIISNGTVNTSNKGATGYVWPVRSVP